jgi:hypothetical protein
MHPELGHQQQPADGGVLGDLVQRGGVVAAGPGNRAGSGQDERPVALALLRSAQPWVPTTGI